MTPEGKVKQQVKAVLKKFDIWYFCPIGGPYTTHGIPDFVCCWKGKFLAIETKAPGRLGDLTANQSRKITEINQHGGLAIVVDNVDDLIKFLLGG